MMWNDSTSMLAAFQEGKFTVLYYPSAVYVDQDILPQTLLEKDSRSVQSQQNTFSWVQLPIPTQALCPVQDVVLILTTSSTFLLTVLLHTHFFILDASNAFRECMIDSQDLHLFSCA